MNKSSLGESCILCTDTNKQASYHVYNTETDIMYSAEILYSKKLSRSSLLQ